MIERIREFTRILIILFFFSLPIALLYVFDPKSFELTWKGHAPLLIFLWLFLLELTLGWKNLLDGKIRWTWFRIAAVIVAGAVPTIYILGTFLFGLNIYIVQLGKFAGVPYQRYGLWFLEVSWPLSLEYVFFTFFFAALVWLMYKIDGLKRFSISLFFLGATGSFYMIDTFYPVGTIVVLQAFAPFTASSAVHILNWLSYGIQLASFQVAGMPVLIVPGLPLLAIGWPCAGVHSLFIYTFVILLFLKGTSFPLQEEIVHAAIPRRLKLMNGSGRIDFLLKRKIIRLTIIRTEKLVVTVLRMVPVYLIVGIGAAGTFIANVLRIVAICIIGVNSGPEAMDLFHNYYGELFFIAWIIIYLTILFLLSRGIRPSQQKMRTQI